MTRKIAELRAPQDHGEGVEHLLDQIDAGNDYPGFQVEYVGVENSQKLYHIHTDS